jgi:hypothetical protein
MTTDIAIKNQDENIAELTKSAGHMIFAWSGAVINIEKAIHVKNICFFTTILP